MATLTLSAKLDRTDSSTSWGFRLHGGKDFGAPLTIQKVSPGSLAAKCGLQVDDTIVKIGNATTIGMLHKQAQQSIIQCGNSLDLELERGSSRGLRGSAPQQSAQAPSGYGAPQQPTSNPPSGAGGPGSTFPVAVNKQYNTPINMYSVDNVMNTLADQTATVSIGQPGSEEAAVSSDPQKLVHEEENAPPPQKHALHPSITNKSDSLLSTRNVSPVPFQKSTATRVSPVAFKSFNAPGRSYSPVTTGAAPPPITLSSPDPTTPPLPPPPPEDDLPSSDMAPPLPQAPPPSSQTMPQSVPKTQTVPSGVKASARYEEQPSDRDSPQYKGYTNPAMQSRSFKALQTMIDSGEDVSSLAMGRRSPQPPSKPTPPEKPADVSAKAIVNKQYNTPIGLYSGQNVQSTFHDQASDILQTMSGANDTVIEQTERKKILIPSAALKVTQSVQPTEETEAQGKKVYHPSETFRLVQEEDKGPTPEKTDKGSAVHSKTFQMLQKQLDKPGGAPVSKPAAPPSSQVVGSWQPSVPTGPRNMRVGQRGDARNMPAAPGRVPVCAQCNTSIRGPFVSALDKTWCPAHFVCANPHCRQSLLDVGFVEEAGQLFCENDYREYFAPRCGKCNNSIIGEVVNALQNTFHSHCFVCCHCRQPIGAGSFHTEDGNAYCVKDWGALFQTKCYGCQFPIEPGDRWVEALSQNWHSECFNCSTCQQNLEGQSFYAKAGKPFCKRHATGRM